jgi:hypothetical protein
MTTPALVTETENHLRQLAHALTDPRDGECLLCYVFRMLDHGCTGLRWARRYRDLRAPRATALERRLGRMGGYCDCEIFLNGVELAEEYWVPGEEETDLYGDVTLTDPTYPDPMPPCHGVRAGSTQGCGLWVRQWRRRRW